MLYSSLRRRIAFLPMGKGKKAKANHALDALSSQIAKAFWEGMQRRGQGQSLGDPPGRGDWDCSCGTRANFASRSKCRNCGKPRPSGVGGSLHQPSGGGGGHGGGGGGRNDVKQPKVQGESAGKTVSTWASVVANRGRARDPGGNGGGNPAKGNSGPATAADPQARPDEGQGKQGGDDARPKEGGDDADADDSVAAARSHLAKQERILKLLADEGAPSDDELVKAAAARVDAAKARLEAARSANPPPAYALLNAERKVASAVKAEKRAKEAVADAEKALGEARKAHMQAAAHREAMENRVQELRTAVGRPPAVEEERQRNLHTAAERLCTQLVALPGAKNAGNGELAWGQIEVQVKSLVQLLQTTMAEKPNAKPPAAAAGAPAAAAALVGAAAGAAGGRGDAVPAPTSVEGDPRATEPTPAQAALPAARELGPGTSNTEPPPTDANLPPPTPTGELQQAAGDTDMQAADDDEATGDAQGIPTAEEYERFVAREEEKKRRRLGLGAKESAAARGPQQQQQQQQLQQQQQQQPGLHGADEL